MAQFQDRDQVRSEEQFEAALTGPFGGVQSELPPTEIEAFGFLDAKNFMFRKGAAYVRPGWTALPAFPNPANEPILAVADFFNANGTQIQCVITPTRLLQFVTGNWTNITGPGFGGTSTQLFGWDVLNYKLCFSQGVDKIWTWDGIAANYVQSSANAPPAKYIAEIGLHLVAVNPAFPQRYIWSGIGDPTDWTSFSSGLNDNVSNLGPINGVLKLGQYGYGFHQKGVLQIIPTGIGLAPFAFVSSVNAKQGCIAPYSLAHYDDQGREFAVFLGVDNVYTFDGSSIEPIGDMPIDQRRRLGARSRILTDVMSVNINTIYGYVTYSINGQPFRAYWLVIPGTSVWVYNFDEGNWTVFTYTKTLVTIGSFFKNSAIRIIDLQGRIQDQLWTPATLQQNNPFEGFLLGFNDGTAGYVDFTNFSEVNATLASGTLIFGDRRHKKTVKKFRLTFVDLGSATFTIFLSNEIRQIQTKTFTVGSGTNDVLNYIQEFTLPGLRFQYTVFVPSGTPTAIVELAPIYDMGGEQRGGLLEN
jgi:hypothetical protein